MRKSVSAERAAHEDMQRRADDNRRLVDQLRERQGLLDRLFRIQRSISHRAPTNDVLDAITAGASELLGVGRVELRLRDQDSHADLVLVSSIGVDADAGDGPDVIDHSDPAGGRSVRENRLVIVTGESISTDSSSGRNAAMAAPVHVNGEPVGCLVVGSSDENRRYSPPEQEALLAFAEHASLALQDARAIHAMRTALRRQRPRAEHGTLTPLPHRLPLRPAAVRPGGRADTPDPVVVEVQEGFVSIDDGHVLPPIAVVVPQDEPATVRGRLSRRRSSISGKA